MELQVDICKLELQRAKTVNVRCTADNGFEVCEPASAGPGTANSPQRSKTWPKFGFRFAAASGPQVIVSFSVCDAATGTEVAKCAVLVPLQTGSDPSQDLVSALSGTDSQECRTAILTTPIAGTDIGKFAGKVHFSTQHTYTVPPSSEVMALPWPSAMHQLQRDSSAHINDLVARETAALANNTVVPDDGAIVTIIFHSLNLESAPDIKFIACPGRNGVEQRVKKVIQDKVGRIQSILVQKKLRCTDAESIEICITNPKTGHVIFHTLLPLASLQPFVYKHWCQPFTGGNSASFATLVEKQRPGMVATAVLTPPKSSYHQYEGLELCICSVDPGFSTDYSKIVVCAQIINKNSKSRLREPNFYDPPFEEDKQTKKKATECNRQDALVYKMAVMNIAPRCEEAYFFFPTNHEIHISGNFALQLVVYPIRPIASTPWWEAPQVGSISLEISSALGFLMQADCHNGVRWEVAIEQPVGSMSPEEENRVLSPAESEGTISAVLRWKTRQVPFMSLPTALDLQTLPDLNTNMSAGSPVMETPVTVPIAPTSRDPNPVRNEAELLLTQHQKAISQMGQDILQLRQQNASLAVENQQLQSQMRSICGSESRDYAELEAMGKHELVQTVLLLQNELQAETATRIENQNRIQGLQGLLARQRDCEAQYVQLLEVHAVQQKLVQQLQSKVQKLQRCYEICKQQQTIVNQLEALLAHQITTQDMTLMEVTARLQMDNAELKTSLQSYQDEDDTQQKLGDLQQSRLEAELSQALARCRQLEALLEQKGGRGPEGRHNLELEQRLRLAETQVGTLLTELKDSARKWAAEKSHYEIKLAEYQTRSDVETTCADSSGKVISF